MPGDSPANTARVSTGRAAGRRRSRGDALTEADLRAFADDRLTDYRRPKSVAFVDELPQTPDGKVDAKVLLEPHRADEDRQIW